MPSFKALNLALSFFLELCMLVAFAVWGFHTATPIWAHWLLGLGIPAAVMLIWGSLLAPRSSARLNIRWGITLTAVLFSMSAIALYSSGYILLANLFIFAIFINLVLKIIWRQW